MLVPVIELLIVIPMEGTPTKQSYAFFHAIISQYLLSS